MEVGCVSSIVSPSHREEICAFGVRSDCAFSEGGGPASASRLPLPRHRSEQQRRADIGEFLCFLLFFLLLPLRGDSFQTLLSPRT